MENIFIGKKVFSSLFALLIATSANANLVTNGDFEEAVRDSSVQGWGVSELYDEGNVVAWGAGANDYIELWTEDSNSFAELNAHSGSSDWLLRQKVELEADVEYNFSFDYRARQTDDEVFQFRVKNSDGLSSWTTVFDHDQTNQWYTYEGILTGTDAARHIIQFKSVNDGDTYGNFIDNVSITAKVTTTDIPEPGTFILFALCLVGLGFSGKKLHS